MCHFVLSQHFVLLICWMGHNKDSIQRVAITAKTVVSFVVADDLPNTQLVFPMMGRESICSYLLLSYR